MATERLRQQVEQLLDEAQKAVTGLDWTLVRDRARAALSIDQENADGLACLRRIRATCSPSGWPPIRIGYACESVRNLALVRTIRLHHVDVDGQIFKVYEGYHSPVR